MGAQLLDSFRRRIDRATDARLGRSRGSPQRGEQVVQEQHGLAGGDADNIAARVDPPTFTKTHQHDVFLFGVDEHIANVLQAGQEDDLIGQGLAGLQRFFNGCFQPAERDLAERGSGMEAGRDLLGSTGPARREACPGYRRWHFRSVHRT